MYAPSICSSDSFCGKGKWYLPALRELYTINESIATINLSFTKIPDGQKLKSLHYWSSTEYDHTGAWLLSFYSGDYGYDGKWYNTHPMRPVLAF